MRLCFVWRTGVCHLMGSSWKKAAYRLREKRGASLAAALLFFVVCAVVGSVILSAAMSALGSSASRDLGDQQRYDVSSAAALLAEDLSGNFSLGNSSGGTTVPYDSTKDTFTFTSESYSYYTSGDSKYYAGVDEDGVPTGGGLSENDYLKNNVQWKTTGLLPYHAASGVSEENLTSLRSAMALEILSAYWLGTGENPAEASPAGNLIPQDGNYQLGQSISWDSLARYDKNVLSNPCVVTLTPNYTSYQDADRAHSVTAKISMDDSFQIQAELYLSSDGSYEKTSQPYLVELDPGDISYVFRKVTESTAYSIRYTYVPDETEEKTSGTSTERHSDWINADSDFTPKEIVTTPQGYHIDPSGTQLRTYVTEHLTFTLSFPGWQSASQARITTVRPTEQTSGS